MWLNKILRWFGINYPDIPSEKERCKRTQRWIDLYVLSKTGHWPIYQSDIDKLRKINEDWDFVKGCRVKKKKTDVK